MAPISGVYRTRSISTFGYPSISSGAWSPSPSRTCDRLCVCGAREAGHGRIERVVPEGVLGFVEEAGEADPTDGVARARGLLNELCAELVPCLPAERAPGNEPERTLLLTFSYGDLVHGPVAIGRREP